MRNKKTLRFAYWINAALKPEPAEWYAMYYVQCGEGVTQWDACKALGKGYLLDPNTPTLAQWKKQNKKVRA